MNINDWHDVNLKDLVKVREVAASISASFDSSLDLITLNLQSYRELSNSTEFLFPVFVNFIKKVDSADLLDSKNISDKRKKILRYALNQAERKGFFVKITNPVTEDDFNRFKNFYDMFGEEKGFENLLTYKYLERKGKNNCMLIEVFNQQGEYFGGRLVGIGHQTLLSDYRAVAYTKEIKDGFDVLCEYAFYNEAVKRGLDKLARGRNLNFRGIDNNKVGLIWNKMKWGYAPVVMRRTPRVYVDLKFLNEFPVDEAVFLSIENEPNLTSRTEKYVWNFVISDGKPSEMMESFKRFGLPVRLFDKNFKEVLE